MADSEMPIFLQDIEIEEYSNTQAQQLQPFIEYNSQELVIKMKGNTDSTAQQL